MYIFTAFLVIITPYMASSETIIVEHTLFTDNNTTYPFPINQIQKALFKASDGDTILVPAGIFYEQGAVDTALIIDKSIALIGAGFDKTTISAYQGHYNRESLDDISDLYLPGISMIIRADDVRIEGFRFETPPPAHMNRHRTTIVVESSSPTIMHNYMIGNTPEGVIMLRGNSSPIINNNSIRAIDVPGIRLVNNPNTIDARYNYWWKNSLIDELIWDNNDEAILGNVEFLPWLIEENHIATMIMSKSWGEIKRHRGF